jgi:hypothetical protein
MSKQLVLFSPGIFDLIRADEGPAYIRRLEAKVKKLELSVRSYKGHFTKQQRRNNNPKK